MLLSALFTWMQRALKIYNSCIFPIKFNEYFTKVNKLVINLGKYFLKNAKLDSNVDIIFYFYTTSLT